MKEEEHWVGRCMAVLKESGLLRYSLLVVTILLTVSSGAVEGQGSQNITFVFFETPLTDTLNTTATFRWGVVFANGSNPCLVDQCVNQCKLDNESFQNCTGQVAIFSNLTDGLHSFTILLSTLRGYFYTNDTSWTVDTVPPTAAVTAGPSYTNAVNVSVGIKFSELCTSPGFRCPGVSDCDIYVSGPGIIIPSSLVVHTFGLEYSITVALSTAVQSGKVDIRMAPPRKGICVDAAGNTFVRKASSIFTVRFSRTVPTVNMWTPVQDSQVEINSEYRTISATNVADSLILYLDFSDPMITPASQLLNALQISHGTLSPRTRRRFQRKYFAFSINNVSDFSIISVTLPANSSANLYGTPVVQTSNIAFLYDSTPLRVSLSTTTLAKTKNHFIPFLIQFTKPTFSFGANNVIIYGGNLTRFLEVSKSTYIFELYIADDRTVSVGVDGNVTHDIAGNANLPSNILRVRHYTEPSLAVALYSFCTAGLIATTLASGALSISSATLVAAGALNGEMSGADPSRNLLGMATHLQLFALSDWLAVSLPVDYRETTRGLRWMIPHVKAPWQKQPNSTSLNNPLLQQVVQPKDPISKLRIHGRRRLLRAYDHKITHEKYHSTFAHLDTCKTDRRSRATVLYYEGDPLREPALDRGNPISSIRSRSHIYFDKTDVSLPWGCQETTEISHRSQRWTSRRRLGPNMTAYGPAIGTDKYTLYFDNDTSNTELRNLFHRGNNAGWRDFARNMFWIGAVGGGLVTLHGLLLLFLRWKTKTSVRGVLTIPRFELFLLTLSLPGISQALAFIVRGSTTIGIIVGILLLAIPAAFLLTVVLFLVIAILIGSLVQYKEVIIRQPQPLSDDAAHHLWRSKLIRALAGSLTVARWVRNGGMAPTFLPRYGFFFEDRKGPPKWIIRDGGVGGRISNWVESGSNGVGKMRAMNSDDECDEVYVPLMQKIMGGARAAYLFVDIFRRIALGVIFGAFSRSDNSWVQVVLAFGFTLFQLLYLIFFKPYIRRGVQVVESISLLCETGLFVVALILLGVGHPSDDHFSFGIVLLALLLVSFVSQLVNEWYALMTQLLRLSATQEPSLKAGIKMLGRGMVLPFVPRRRWGKFISPHQRMQRQPCTGLVPVVPPSPDGPELPEPEVLERARRSSTSVHTGSPLIAFGPQAVVPGYDPGSPAFIDPRIAVTDEAVVSGEIKGEASASAAAVALAGAKGIKQEQYASRNNGANWGSRWKNSRSMEGKRSTRGSKTDSKSGEMRILRNIAKASFPRWRKHEEVSDPGLEISSPVHSNLGTGASGAARRLSSSAPSRVGGTVGATGEGEQAYTDDSSNNSSEDERYYSRFSRPHLVGESSIDVLGNTSRGVTPHSSSSFEKGSRGSGPLETTLSGGSMPLRELIQER